MRKLLLATVAALGASMGAASYADAQVVDSSDSGQSYPTPGTVTVRLNGRFRFYFASANDGGARSSNFGLGATQGSAPILNTAGATVATASAANQGINKLAGYGIIEYARLYPGFDGVAANGLKYGASLEVRQDSNFGAGGGYSGSITGETRSEGLLYLRREWGYIGTDRFGTLRLVASDQPTSLFLTGTFETFDDGGLDGDLGDMLPGAVQTTFPFADQGNLYATNKIVYASPQFFGFDGGVSFEPNTAAVGNSNSDGCGPTASVGQLSASGNSVATPGCTDLSSTSTSDYARRRNTYEGLVRYRGTFGPVGIAATASYTGSGRVQDSGVVGSTTNPKRYPLEDLSVGDFGLVMTFGGLSFGGNYEFGRYNVQGGGGFGGLIAKGQPNSSAMIVGSTYTIGPVIFGAHYMRSFSQGDQTTATSRTSTGGALASTAVLGGQRLEQGVGAGSTYSLAPGVALYLSYIWEHKRQNGFNFLTGGQNSTAAGNVNGPAGTGNKTDASVIAIGSSFAW